jgi:hypothetical protein
VLYFELDIWTMILETGFESPVGEG